MYNVINFVLEKGIGIVQTKKGGKDNNLSFTFYILSEDIRIYVKV